MLAPYLSRLLALPFVLLIIYYFSYGQFQSEYYDELILIPSMIIIVLLYVFNEQINKWWWKVRPLRLEPRIQSWIETYSLFYQSLEEGEQRLAQSQISKLMLIKEFTLKSKKDYQLEEDMKAIIAHEMYRLTCGISNYIYPSCKHIVMYNHLFATPDYQYLHSVEFNREDGVRILARDATINGFNAGLDHFNVALYGAIIMFMHENSRLDYPSTKDLDLQAICDQLGLNLESIEAHVGPGTISPLGLMIYSSLEYPERVQTHHESVYRSIQAILNP